jgi:hypothetical protein
MKTCTSIVANINTFKLGFATGTKQKLPSDWRRSVFTIKCGSQLNLNYSSGGQPGVRRSVNLRTSTLGHPGQPGVVRRSVNLRTSTQANLG